MVSVSCLYILVTAFILRRAVAHQDVSKSKTEVVPTAKELRLPETLSPISYDLTIRIYLKGFVQIAAKKESTFDAVLRIKFRVNQATDKIVLNALNLNLNEDPKAYNLTGLNEVKTPEVSHNRTLLNTIVTDRIKRLKDSCEHEMKLISFSDDANWVSTEFKETLKMSSYLVALTVSELDFVEGRTSGDTRVRIWARSEGINQTAYALSAGIKALEFFEQFYGIKYPLEKQGEVEMFDRHEDDDISDMVALPDFAAGAMENWGLITYREKLLLYDSTSYAPRQKMDVANVIAHELAHQFITALLDNTNKHTIDVIHVFDHACNFQWFGNLVTMKWWNDLWLNEGFASFMEYLGANAISDNNFEMNDFFAYDAIETALERDAYASSHPLFFEIEKAEDLVSVFDGITYKKGASIIRMIEAVMGDNNFKKGVMNYLNKYKYSNADHENLWEMLNEAVPDTALDWNGKKLNIASFASKWIEQMGYPVIEVKRLNRGTVKLSQKRFKPDENVMEKAKYRNPKYGYKYDSPIWYANNQGEEKMIWLHEDEEKTINLDESGHFIVNSGTRGFYRVKYDTEIWEEIIKQLNSDHKEIDLHTRIRLLADAFALAKVDMINYDIPLKMSKYLGKEDEFVVWVTVSDSLSGILKKFSGLPEAEDAKNFMKSITAPLYDKINWVTFETSYLDDKMYSQNEIEKYMIGLACAAGYSACTNKMATMFKNKVMDACQGAITSECAKIVPTIRLRVYCEGVKNGGQKEWDAVLEWYKAESVKAEKDRLLYALACSKDVSVLEKFIDKVVDRSHPLVRLQDVRMAFYNLASEDSSKKILFDYFTKNWKKLYKE
ncbi:unnamed protein product [Anisakis simplex]|uniref:Aminopeptidase n=1 Tax=Anisakis simplex TaxID=6269 RepID=A0A0M3K3Z8_ANISI|nr:unnamed protein product [Anisakis simplex]